MRRFAETEGVFRLQRVQLPPLAVGTHAVPVENAVGHVRRLLDFRHHHAPADGVDRARRNEEDIAGLYRMEDEQGVHRTGLHRIQVLLLRNPLFETDIEATAFVRIHHIPHLGFTVGAMAQRSQFIVGMHLHREVVLRVDELDQQREIVAAAVEHLLADEVAHIDLDQLRQGVVSKVAVGHHRLFAVDARQFPAFAAVG